MLSMLRRHLRLDFRMHLFTDDTTGIDRDIICLPLPREFADTPRCRRRMAQYNRAIDSTLGRRLLSIDLDIVIVDDITPLVDRPEPVVMWHVGHANVYSGSFVLWDAGALHGAYAAYAADPNYPTRTERNGSDQAMVNAWLQESRTPVVALTEADGFVTWYGGERYRKMQHLGMGPERPELPKGARMVVLGSSDKAVMDEGRYPWVRECWV